MTYWLLKSEPDAFSFDDLKTRPKRREAWDGIRNYQVRNFIRDQMGVGDLGLFYHSSCPEPGACGVVRICSEAFPDPLQFDKRSKYHDPKSPRDNPRWLARDVEWVADFPRFVPLAAMKAEPEIEDMLILRRGNRLSVTPVEVDHFRKVCRMGGLRGIPAS